MSLTLLETGCGFYQHQVKCKNCVLWPDRFMLDVLTYMLMMFEKGLISRSTIITWKTNTIMKRQAYKLNIWMQTTFTGEEWSKNYHDTRLHGKKIICFTPEKNKQTNKLVNKKRKYFKNQTRVSKKAALEAHRNAILAKRMTIGKVEKMVLTLKDKKTYEVHYKKR